ncbi:MAG: putative quinol monooxygenase [Candidatus Poribacteria bacterium]|nr:putative quinol monooxygenase [Candidatus Poribacteria bacterium]
MYVIVEPIQIKEGHRDAFIEALLDDAKGSMNNEPGCLRFDVIQDGAEPNRIWLYEVYVDEAAFRAHLQAPHCIKCRDTVKDWSDEAPKGAGTGSSNIWPPDDAWKPAKGEDNASSVH